MTPPRTTAETDARPPDRGETLLELVITITITGIAILVLLGGLGTSIRVSDIHRKQSLAGAYLRAFAEALETAVAESPSKYAACADHTYYTGLYSLADKRYAATATTVAYWDGSTFAATCTPTTDIGVQQISLEVRSVDNAAIETLDLIVREPCRPPGDFPLDKPCA